LSINVSARNVDTIDQASTFDRDENVGSTEPEE
jgi:hypothetical protein